MSEENFCGIARQALLEKDPNFFTIDLAKHAENTKQLRTERAAANPPKTEPAQKELSRLRGELFKLEQHAKHSEIYTNEQAGQVKLLEVRINDQIKLKKDAALAGNLRGERLYEDSVQRLERELADATAEFNRARKVSACAAIVLKEWPHQERMQELEKLVA